MEIVVAHNSLRRTPPPCPCFEAYLGPDAQHTYALTAAWMLEYACIDFETFTRVLKHKQSIQTLV
jgi:hypothetical protein